MHVQKTMHMQHSWVIHQLMIWGNIN